MIRVPPPLLAEIEAAALAAWPEEACGLLVGREDGDGLRVTRVAASPNVAEGDRRRRFEVSPQLRFDLMRELRGGADRLIGHFHSHPDGPAVPSAHDRERAFEPDLIWLILPVSQHGAGRARVWQADAEATAGFREIALVSEVADLP